eukprot:4645370-Amphidinium_carterae.1
MDCGEGEEEGSNFEDLQELSARGEEPTTHQTDHKAKEETKWGEYVWVLGNPGWDSNRDSHKCNPTRQRTPCLSQTVADEPKEQEKERLAEVTATQPQLPREEEKAESQRRSQAPKREKPPQESTGTTNREEG